jgi:hypothetical protein
VYVCVCVCVCVRAPLSVALVIEHAKSMRRIMLTSVACPAPKYFSTLTHKRQDFRGGKKLFFFLPGRARDLSAPLYIQDPAKSQSTETHDT